MTYAAVAAKISIRLAVVIRASANEKHAENKVIIISFSAMDDTKNNAMMDTNGSNDATTVVKISAAPKRSDFL